MTGMALPTIALVAANNFATEQSPNLDTKYQDDFDPQTQHILSSLKQASFLTEIEPSPSPELKLFCFPDYSNGIWGKLQKAKHYFAVYNKDQKTLSITGIKHGRPAGQAHKFDIDEIHRFIPSQLWSETAKTHRDAAQTLHAKAAND